MEGLGFDPLMISDHIAVTPDVAEQYPAPFYEPFTTLAWLAGITGRIRLGTTVLIVPYRHPLLIARMAANLSQGPLRSYWPGAAYVNWVGLDGYYDLPLSNFRNVFVRTIRVVRQFTHDPVLISESAIGQRAGQARKIPNLLRGVLRHHLRGLVWFDVRQQGALTRQDWRLEGHPRALAAFRLADRGFA